jgi:hypothetical protein
MVDSSIRFVDKRRGVSRRVAHQDRPPSGLLLPHSRDETANDEGIPFSDRVVPLFQK